MAEEITCIMYDSSERHGMKKNEVLNVFQYRKTHNLTTPIHLILLCHNKRHGHDEDEDEEFSGTVEMRTAMLENIVHINRFQIHNFCTKRNEHFAWFNYLLQFLRTDHGGTKYVVQYNNFSADRTNYLSLEHVTRLSNVIRLNNNGHIQSFTLCSVFMNTEAFQTIWNTILETDVPHVTLFPEFWENRDGSKGVHTNNDNINFTDLSTNTSVKQLVFYGMGISQHNWRNLFFSIKGNTGLEKLEIDLGSHRSSLHNTELLPCFTEMLRKNVTLINVEASNINDDDVQNEFNNVSTIETKLNRQWNQYLRKRKEDEEKNAAASTTLPPPPLPAHVVAAAERTRRFKMGCLFHAFENKPVMRDSILFHFLSETPDLLIGNEVQHNVNQVFRHKKKKRPRQQQQCGRY